MPLETGWFSASVPRLSPNLAGPAGIHQLHTAPACPEAPDEANVRNRRRRVRNRRLCDRARRHRTWVPPGDDGAHSTPDTENLGWHSGQLNVTYIVDVNGDRLVIDTWHMPGTSAADLAELDAILASMRIEP